MPVRTLVSAVGRRTIDGVTEFGYACALCAESVFWLIAGTFLHQRVRAASVFRDAMAIGVRAIPIAALLCFAVGVMLAIQGIDTLKPYGAQNKVVLGIALSVTREFAPLIIGILVAGRSGSAITARLGTMVQAQEVDALRVIGINPVRYIATPLLLAMLLMVPALTVIGEFMALFGGAVYTALELHMPPGAYVDLAFSIIDANDITQGLVKSTIFAIIIVLIGLINGFQVRGGAEDVGRATTRSVVLAISFIVLADMVFTYLLNH